MSNVKITCRPNGPLMVEGSVSIVDSAGNPVPVDPSRPMIALCRCGHSGRKPFCDGSHGREGWKEKPEPAA